MSAPSNEPSTSSTPSRKPRRLLRVWATLLVGLALIAVTAVATVAVLHTQGWGPEEEAAAAPEVPEPVEHALGTIAGDLYAYDTWRWRGYDFADEVRATILDDWDPESPVYVEESVLDAVDEHAELLASEPIDQATYRHTLGEQRLVETAGGLAYQVDLDRTWRYESFDEGDFSGMVDSFRLYVDVVGDRAIVERLEWVPESGWRD